MVQNSRALQLYHAAEYELKGSFMLKSNGSTITEKLMPILPTSVVHQLESKFDKIDEIHLRANGLSSLTVAGENTELKGVYLSEKDISDTVYKLCQGSVYAHSSELKKGYISYSGIRVGVCGKALYGENGICGFSKYTSLNIRIPHHIKDAANELLRYISEKGTKSVGGILVVSPPCMGKTTFLRSLAASLSKGFYDKGVYTKKRVCIIDEREEIYLPEVFESGYCDVLSSYPKGRGIELCTRVMSPEYIVCDEIGNPSEAEAICEGASKGIIFAASCHGEAFEDIIKRESIKKLFDLGVFCTVCEISLKNSKRCVNVRSVK